MRPLAFSCSWSYYLLRCPSQRCVSPQCSGVVRKITATRPATTSATSAPSAFDGPAKYCTRYTLGWSHGKRQQRRPQAGAAASTAQRRQRVRRYVPPCCRSRTLPTLGVIAERYLAAAYWATNPGDILQSTRDAVNSPACPGWLTSSSMCRLLLHQIPRPRKTDHRPLCSGAALVSGCVAGMREAETEQPGGCVLTQLAWLDLVRHKRTCHVASLDGSVPHGRRMQTSRWSEQRVG
jgi:hypothetical protein